MGLRKNFFPFLYTLSGVVAQTPSVTLDTGIWKGVPTQQAGSSIIVHKYLGLPFAAPPVRFSPPQPPASSTTQKNADKLPPACIQNGGGGFSQGAISESEDCLYLNVFAPAPTNSSTSSKTVMVWFFGGALQFGTASMAGYDGTSFATNQDIILVAPNYRTNIFGFPGPIPGIPIKERNLGFLDQRMALNWVQNNIAKFGGNPKKVTIFGESAGARSVNFHLLTNSPKNPPFRAVIMQSGSAHITPGVVTDANNGITAEPPFVSFARRTGCNSTAGLLECMRQAPAEQIKRLLTTSPQFGAVDDDGFTTVKDAERVRREHLAGNVSLLIGTNADEQKATIAAQRQKTLRSYLDTIFGSNGVLKEQIIKAYPVGPNSIYKTDYDAMAAVATDVGFTCVTSRESKVSAQAGYPTWRFLFNASYPNTEQFPGSGAFHSAEIQFVFGNLKTPKGPSSPEEISLSKAMQTAWASFAKSPAAGPGWDKIGTPSGKDLGHFNYNGKLIHDTPAFLDRNCPLFVELVEKKSGQRRTIKRL